MYTYIHTLSYIYVYIYIHTLSTRFNQQVILRDIRPRCRNDVWDAGRGRIASEALQHRRLVRAVQGELVFRVYRGTSLVRNCRPLGPFCSPLPRVLSWS